MNLKEYILSDENIYLAIYSVKSYVFDSQLLDDDDYDLLLRLQDNFDEKLIRQITKDVRSIIKKVLEQEETYFKTKVYFKPKKYIQEGQYEFRPIHVSPLRHQIAMVAMLNILIYERADCKDNRKLVLSNYSRLLPNNFLGNRVSLRPETLFIPWNIQYKKYTKQANEFFKNFHNTREYKYELKLDIENYFPSINPVYIFNYLLSKKSIALKDTDIKTLKKVIAKLLVCEVTNLDTLEAVWQYYKPGNTNNTRFTVGVAQGLPQSYFFGNIAMIEISKIFQKVFAGKSIFYVDDSYLYTNTKIENIEDFYSQIDQVNAQIKQAFNEYIVNEEAFYACMNQTYMDFHLERKEIYEIRVHTDDKSSYTDIIKADDSEVYLKCLSREASKAGTDMFKSYSDEEDVILKNRTSMMLKAIELELEKAEKETAITEDLSVKAFKEKLVRYYKFFKYRSIKLKLRETLEVDDLVLTLGGLEKMSEGQVDIYECLEADIDIAAFFNLFKNDIWIATLNLLLSKEGKEENRDKIEKYIGKLDEALYGKTMANNSYIKKSYSNYIFNSAIESYQYKTLQINVAKKLKNYTTQHLDVLKKILVDDKLPGLENAILKSFEICEESFLKRSRIVDSNSDELQRMFLNAIYSYLFQVELSDSFALKALGNRGITYGALRILIYLRNPRFKLLNYEKSGIRLSDEKCWQKIDYSILEVIDVFRNFVKNPDQIDRLILVHQYTCDVWKNGAKYLYFYTLHNQEHAVDLVKNIVKITKAISYLQVTSYDYYLLFVACYLHDISMVNVPGKDDFILDRDSSEIISNQAILKLKEAGEDVHKIKICLIEIYRQIELFYEKRVRDSHAMDSANTIRKRGDLKFIEQGEREIVADISEAHGCDTKDIYFTKSDATKKLVSYKFDKILLRFADLLDMSEYRISKTILNHNIDNMSTESKFHWISHVLTQSFSIRSEYHFVKNGLEEDFLKPRNIEERIILCIKVKMSQMSEMESLRCTGVSLQEKSLSEDGFELICGEECESNKCNFLCRWFMKKNYYLAQEMAALQKYLNRVPKRFYQSNIIIKIEIDDRTTLDGDLFETIREYVQKKA